MSPEGILQDSPSTEFMRPVPVSKVRNRAFDALVVMAFEPDYHAGEERRIKAHLIRKPVCYINH